MDVDLEKLKKQIAKLTIEEVGGWFSSKYCPQRIVQHNYKHLRVNKVHSLFLAQVIKLNSMLANNVGVNAIPYDYHFEYDTTDRPYIYCEILPESKRKINIPEYYNSIQGYYFLEICSNYNGKQKLLQDYLKQILFSLYIGDPDRNCDNLIVYFNDNNNICLYPMFDFDQCFNLGNVSRDEFAHSDYYMNEKDTARRIEVVNTVELPDGGKTIYTEKSFLEDDYNVLMPEFLEDVRENSYYYDIPGNEEERFESMLSGEHKSTTDFSSIFKFCYDRLEDKSFIDNMLDYDLNELFNIEDNYGFNKRTKEFYLSLMDIQKQKIKDELIKLEENNQKGYVL